MGMPVRAVGQRSGLGHRVGSSCLPERGQALEKRAAGRYAGAARPPIAGTA
jgi:hypothetical protein